LSYLVLARKWRPQTFDEVVGQEAATRALSFALESGRIAHAFLFTGPRGVGKTTAARILAKALNCEKGPGPRPCNACAACDEITQGRSVDVLEIDGASNTGVDDVRELREKLKYLPARGRYKILIIDEVHMLSTNAFNALLKSLEEPPAHVVFVFATTEPHKIPATVLSRVQRYDFRRIPYLRVLQRLQEICAAEGVEADEGALAVIAREADGSMRDGLSLLDQAWSAAAGGALEEGPVAQALGVVDRATLFGLSRALLSRDARECLRHVDEVFQRGHDVRHFASAVLAMLRDLAVAKVVGDDALLDRGDRDVEEMRALVQPHEAATIFRLFDTLAKSFDEIARAPYPKLLLEMTILKMATAEPLRPIAEALAKLETLERRLGGARIEAPRVRLEAPRVVVAPVARDEEAPGTPALHVPAAPPPAQDGSVEEPRPLGDSQAVWRDILSRLRERRRPLAAVFEQGSLLSLSPDEVVVGFAEPFLLEKAQAAESLAFLMDAAREILGGEAKVRAVAYEGGAGASLSVAEAERKRVAQARDERRRGLAEHPNVVAAQEVLEAKLVEVRDTAAEE
jgi:DNA polymerase-3 subunit gamma/tau